MKECLQNPLTFQSRLRYLLCKTTRRPPYWVTVLTIEQFLQKQQPRLRQLIRPNPQNPPRPTKNLRSQLAHMVAIFCNTGILTWLQGPLSGTEPNGNGVFVYDNGALACRAPSYTPTVCNERERGVGVRFCFAQGKDYGLLRM